MTGEACHVMMKHRRGTPPLHLASQVSTRSYFKQACVCGVVGGPVEKKDPSSSFPILPGGARGGDRSDRRCSSAVRRRRK